MIADFTPAKAAELLVVLRNNTKTTKTVSAEQRKAAFFLLAAAAAVGADPDTGAMHAGILINLMGGRAFEYLTERAAKV